MIERVFGERVLVARDDVTQTKVDDGGEARLEAGQARFAIERVALTANNVTYALMGDTMGYWRFFPAPDGWGCVPVWGVGRCVASESAVEVGQRVYGYWPLAEELVVEVDAQDGGFADPSPHRQGLADVYNRYEHRGEADPAADAIEALFRPLFMTGWLLDRWLAADDDAGAEQIVVTSASSKTAIGMAWTHRAHREGRARLVGLTSPGNVAFVEGLGLYDEVYAYDALPSVAEGRAVLVDIAGDRAFRAEAHAQLALARSVAVGIAHGAPDDDVTVGEPEATFFFAPQAITQLQASMGPSAFATAIRGDWATFAATAADLVDIEVRHGIPAARDAFTALAAGEVQGATSVVVTLGDGSRA